MRHARSLAAIVVGFYLGRLIAILSINGFDWDEVMMLAMGFAGVGYIIVDLKRERSLEQQALTIENRLTRLEQQGPSLDEQLRILEKWIDRSDEAIHETQNRVQELSDRLVHTEASHALDTKRIDAIEQQGTDR